MHSVFRNSGARIQNPEKKRTMSAIKLVEPLCQMFKGKTLFQYHIYRFTTDKTSCATELRQSYDAVLFSLRYSAVRLGKF